jgi:hypothetical protein
MEVPVEKAALYRYEPLALVQGSDHRAAIGDAPSASKRGLRVKSQTARGELETARGELETAGGEVGFDTRPCAWPGVIPDFACAISKPRIAQEVDTSGSAGSHRAEDRAVN